MYFVTGGDTNECYYLEVTVGDQRSQQAEWTIFTRVSELCQNKQLKNG